MGEGENEIAARDLRQQIGAHRRAAAQAEQAAGEHHGREIGLERQRAADRFHHDHGLDRPAGRAAVFFGERQAEETELGIALPLRPAPAAGFLQVALARVEGVVIGEQALHAVTQELLLFSQRKIHFTIP